jgi:hypothetical protein
MITEWANENDEWVRYIVHKVLETGRALPPADEDEAYQLFRQEKALDERELPPTPKLATDNTRDEAELPLTIAKLSDVTGVNALITGEVIEPHQGLTVLFGENGAGKTGYARIFKALAASRTADTILSDISAATEASPSATIRYRLGDEERELAWAGNRGVPPFTRVSIFDSPSVNFHVDEDLAYVYTPAALALFNHIIAGIKGIQSRIDSTKSSLKSASASLVGRFPRDSDVYPLIETLGASTDLADLKMRAATDPMIEERIETARRTIASLEADTLGTQIALRQRRERVLAQASTLAKILTELDIAKYNASLTRVVELTHDYDTFRAELFRAAALPAEPEKTWEAFIVSGEEYKRHLEEHEVYDQHRCLYCRQSLEPNAASLVQKYGDYLADKIKSDIIKAKAEIGEATLELAEFETAELAAFIDEHKTSDETVTFFASLEKLHDLTSETRSAIKGEIAVAADLNTAARPFFERLSTALEDEQQDLVILREKTKNRAETLSKEKKELTRLTAAAELSKSWDAIESQVRDAKQADRLELLARPLPGLCRSVTTLSKSASDELINQSFDKLFLEECESLRAPSIQVEFIGREGKAHRRKVLHGKHKPSKVLSEGEQKVLAIADFIAEARLAGITAPVVFDDPVSSLDHRRVREVARRIASLADGNQIIVFTHDILFTTHLLSLFEKTKRCTYYQITDETGKGKVTRATGPRWDTLSNIKKTINETIDAARKQDGEARAALVRTGYDWIRSWCEVFTETELLQRVTERYQPNVRMTALASIKLGQLPAAIETVTRIFEDACRYIDAHSQPLPTLGISATLATLEADWQELKECKKFHDTAD